MRKGLFLALPDTGWVCWELFFSGQLVKSLFLKFARNPKWKQAEGQCEWGMFFQTHFYRSTFMSALWTHEFRM